MIKNNYKAYNIKFNITAHSLKDKACHVPPFIKVPFSLLDNFTEIQNFGMEKPPYYRIKCQLKIALLMIEILSIMETGANSHESEYRPEKKRSSHLQFVLDYLYNNYHSTITAQIIEAECGYSYRYLSTIFKNEFGVAPTAFLERLRIEKAKDLICHSDYELKRIAEIVGFHSVHYFTSVFKKQIGLPPGEWRKREINGIGKDIFIKEDFINKMYIGECL